ncbi:MAG TPA: DUF309 domain-containing protein [Trebonia sp.]|nr:DUF309 domain-containing protein [Trebonia sp.]
MTHRDRDESGRPRNARRRDELGRPLARDAGHEARQLSASAPISPGEVVDLGAAMLLEGRPFHAHEVFEDAWKPAAGPERDLWRGLAQVAVGLTHARRGNARGAVALLGRGASRLRDYTAQGGAPAPYGVDVIHVASTADELATRIGTGGLSAISPADLLLRLQREPSS